MAWLQRTTDTPFRSQASGVFNVTPWQSAQFMATMNHIVTIVNSLLRTDAFV